MIWVCLLRGVDLGAHNKLSMPDLRVALAEAGLSEVRTYLQRGNVIVNSKVTRRSRSRPWLINRNRIA